MKKIIFILGLLVFLVGCSNKKEQKIETKDEQKVEQKVESENKQNDTKNSKSEGTKQDLKNKFSDLSNKIVTSLLNTENMSDEDYKKHLESEIKNLDEERNELDKIKTDNKEENEIITSLKNMINNAKSLYIKKSKDVTDTEISNTIEQILSISDTYFGGEIPSKLDKVIQDSMR